MRYTRFLVRISAAVVLLLPCGCAVTRPAAPAKRDVTAADIERWISELSNWGRWGADDELGALRFITPAKRREAAALVREGISISLARDAEKVEAIDNADPFEHTMLATGLEPLEGQWCIDRYSVAYHGYAHTHMDALCHIFHGGKIYNGFPQSAVGPEGAAKLGIENARNGIFTRGILIDIPRLRGVPYLEPGTPIFVEDLEAWERKTGLRVSRGDVIFVRTGKWARRAERGPWDLQEEGLAGLHASCARWIHDREVAMIGSDAAMDVLPSGVDGVTHPVHLLALYAMGVGIFDNCDLEALAAAAAERKRWEFLLTAAPLAVPGGTGSPLNPIATF